MNVHDRLQVTKSRSYVKKVLAGELHAPFPEVVDNTMRSAFRKCEKSFFFEFLLNRVMGADSIHLVAGAAFAAANDKFRQTYYGPGGKDFDKALDAAIYELIRTYGYVEERDNDADWATSNKSCDRMLTAVIEYWKEYHPKKGLGKMVFLDGKPASETGTTFDLDVKHPETGKPLKYHIRWDYLEERNGKIWLGDDKTTGSLGASWARQWDMRAQFMGYTYGARREMGIEAVGVIARGTGILKNSISHMEVPVSFPPHLLAMWWEQVNKDYQKMVDKWQSGDFWYDLADGCNAYGGCKFTEVCRAKHQINPLCSMPLRVWNPADPEDSPTVSIEELE